MVFLAFGFSGCRTTENLPPQEDENASVYIPEDDKPISPGDRLRIAVSASGKPEIPEELKEVSVLGEIIMPHIGRVQCVGLGTNALQEKLAEAYSAYYREPEVTVYYVASETPTSPYGTVIVGGQVTQPGLVSIPPTRDLTVMGAIQQVRGMTRFADTRKVLVTRGKGDAKKQYRINLDEVAKGNQPDMRLQADDRVFVEESYL